MVQRTSKPSRDKHELPEDMSTTIFGRLFPPQLPLIAFVKDVKVLGMEVVCKLAEAWAALATSRVVIHLVPRRRNSRGAEGNIEIRVSVIEVDTANRVRSMYNMHGRVARMTIAVSCQSVKCHDEEEIVTPDVFACKYGESWLPIKTTRTVHCCLVRVREDFPHKKD